MFSIVDKDLIKIFSASAAFCWFSRRPNSGASTVFRTNPAGTKSRRLCHQKRGSSKNFARKRKTAYSPVLKGNKCRAWV